MKNITTEYFKDLFRSNRPGHSKINRVLSGIQRRVSHEQNMELNRSFTITYIERALKGPNHTKAPGPDGAHANFFQKYWLLIGSEISRVCLAILNEGKKVQNMNNTLIALIPKTTKPKFMKDYTPISLCNVVYKLIAKVIVEKMKPILEKVISLNHAAFVPKRLISDNVVWVLNVFTL